MRISRMAVLGGRLAAAEAVDEDLAAVGSGGGPGEGLQLIGELIGIVGKHFQVVVFEDERADVGVRCGGDFVDLFFNLQDLRFSGQYQLGIELLRPGNLQSSTSNIAKPLLRTRTE